VICSSVSPSSLVEWSRTPRRRSDGSDGSDGPEPPPPPERAWFYAVDCMSRTSLRLQVTCLSPAHQCSCMRITLERKGRRPGEWCPLVVAVVPGDLRHRRGGRVYLGKGSPRFSKREEIFKPSKSLRWTIFRTGCIIFFKVQSSLICIAQYHEIQICLRGLYNLYTEGIPDLWPHIRSGKTPKR